MALPLIGSSGGLTEPHRLLPFLRFSTLYPKMLVPPVLVGADQARLIQSLKALTTFSVVGGPGYAERMINGHFLTGSHKAFFLNQPTEFETLSQIHIGVLVCSQNGDFKFWHQKKK